MAPAIISTGATRTLKVSGRRETAGCSSISMMENRVLRGYQAEARGRGESELQHVSAILILFSQYFFKSILSYSYPMSNEDIGKEIIDFECEHCKRIIKVTLSQIAREDTVKCVCGSDIKLLDENGSFKKAIKDINSALNKF